MKKSQEIVEFLSDLGIRAVNCSDYIQVNRDDIENTFGHDELIGAVRQEFGKGFMWSYRDDNHFHLSSVY